MQQPEDWLEGVVDGASVDTVRGWIWLPASPEIVPIVEVRSAGALLGQGKASSFRQDLLVAGKRNGHCAFVVVLDPPLAGDVEIEVVATYADRVQALTPSPLRVQAAPGNTVAEPPADSPDVLPLPLATTAGLRGFIDRCGPDRISGWGYWNEQTDRPLSLMLYRQHEPLIRLNADQWRADVAELRDGDGACGFDVAVPEILRDGRMHTLDLRIDGTDRSALNSTFRVQIRPSPSVTAVGQPSPLTRKHGDPGVGLSIIVVFYNMDREARRTLTSLSTAYQLQSEGFIHEVLCVDNGSDPPMDANLVSTFGPQFRLIRPAHPHPSPCAAINEAAMQARGAYLAVMIDGAHMLTPGVFKEASLAWREDPSAMIALRHWFIGGDQRWLTAIGYSREMEDRLFERIRWPANGYELFRISAPIGEPADPWFDAMSESNCLMLPTSLYDQIGGMDESFDEPGGGFANLDLWRRACEASERQPIVLIGEASFHQFHGGTTTNVEDTEKDRRVRLYADAYRRLRGRPFEPISRSGLRFRGAISSDFAIGHRQRVAMPLRLGITPQIRPGQLARHFDDGAQTYLQSVYAECGLHKQTTWLGRETDISPSDLVGLQQLLHGLQPDCIVLFGVLPGLVAFIHTLMASMGSHDVRLVCIEPAAPLADGEYGGLCIPGPAADADTLAKVRSEIGVRENVLVIVSAKKLDDTLIDIYASFVSHRSWLICLGTLFGQPWLGYSSRNHLQTIRRFIERSPGFVIDRSQTNQLLSTSPAGYLRKTRHVTTAATYDDSLDQLFALEDRS